MSFLRRFGFVALLFMSFPRKRESSNLKVIHNKFLKLKARFTLDSRFRGNDIESVFRAMQQSQLDHGMTFSSAIFSSAN
ncbi:hypothetical protein [Rickettsia endosymbiont of Ixodes pacificus]|uniref:hypothetical protein n=1 Tax=Rickettsia endosymbiont of Ixodes pacificus TaxID=1133329 RepID=UPI001E3707E5|nr:hypothetical protein [Rickettsia endosymbiont of Ixodes pacificus]